MIIQKKWNYFGFGPFCKHGGSASFSTLNCLLVGCKVYVQKTHVVWTLVFHISNPPTFKARSFPFLLQFE
jgi:hypothetical protein